MPPDTLRVAYADPPYLGCAVTFYGGRHPDAGVYDTLEGHRDLVGRLVAEFPDGWALSMTTGNLRDLLPLCPPDCRVGAWTKPFCSWKKGVNPAYCWEPVVWRGGRKLDNCPKIRDYCRANVTLNRGFPGAKPDGFCCWVFELLGLRPTDQFVDLFPGSGAVGRAWDRWCREWYGLYPPGGGQ